MRFDCAICEVSGGLPRPMARFVHAVQNALVCLVEKICVRRRLHDQRGLGLGLGLGLWLGLGGSRGLRDSLFRFALEVLQEPLDFTQEMRFVTGNLSQDVLGQYELMKGQELL